MHPAQSISLITSSTSQTVRTTYQCIENNEISFVDHLSALQGETNHSSKAGESGAIPFGSAEGNETLLETEFPSTMSSEQANSIAGSDSPPRKNVEDLSEPATESGSADTATLDQSNLPFVECSMADPAASSLPFGEQSRDVLAPDAQALSKSEDINTFKSLDGARSKGVEGDIAAVQEEVRTGALEVDKPQDVWLARRIPSEQNAPITSAVSSVSHMVDQSESLYQIRDNLVSVPDGRSSAAIADKVDLRRAIPNGNVNRIDSVSLEPAKGSSAEITSVANASNPRGMPLMALGLSTPSGLACEFGGQTALLPQGTSSLAIESTQSQQPSVGLQGTTASPTFGLQAVRQLQPDANGTIPTSPPDRLVAAQTIGPVGMSSPAIDFSQADKTARDMSDLGFDVSISSRTTTRTSEGALNRASLAQQVQSDGKVRAQPEVSVSPSRQTGLGTAPDQDTSAAMQGRSEMEAFASQADKAEDFRQNLVSKTSEAAKTPVQHLPQGRWSNAEGDLAEQPDSPSIVESDAVENEERNAADTPARIIQRPDSARDVQNGTTPSSLTGVSNPVWATGDFLFSTEQEFESALELDLSEVFSDRGREGVGTTTVRQSETSSAALRTASRSLAETISDRVQLTSRESFDVRLSPEELGNLRISFTNAESGLSVSIHADRPETLDLFRRNIEVLSADLRALGYEDVSMSFAEGRSEGGDHPGTRQDRDGNSGDILAARSKADIQATNTSTVSGAGLDLRL